jgi:AraC-like DNA-binding protein/quercetin dioxygenase-like cupin family protein
MPASISVLDSTVSHSTVTVGNADVSHIAFAPDRVLTRHTHPRGCVAVVVEGAVEKSFARRTTTARAGAVVTMPPEEPHADVFGRTGARIVVVETNADPSLDNVSWSRDWDATVIALRIARELAAPDDFTPLALEGLVLELTAARHRHPRGGAKAPRWLRSVCELLDERLPEQPSLDEIADEVGLHPAHVARAFRAHFGQSVGSYTRRRRLEWAAGELIVSDTPLRSLALAAGFADQSHFTRAFKCFAGVSPGRYRDAHSR